MKRDKARDDKFFNCFSKHEVNYVAGLYSLRENVKKFLEEKSKDGTIKYMTHRSLYELIEKELGYPMPNN